MKLDRGIVNARLAATTGDTGVFAIAYREHVPALLAEIDRLNVELVGERDRHDKTYAMRCRLQELTKSIADEITARFEGEG